MKKFRYPVVLISLLICTVNYGQDSFVEKGLQSINSEAIRAQLGFLASDWMEGREAGEKGAWLAADYIAAMLQLYGVKPGGDFLPLQSYYENNRPGRSYFQNFVMLKTAPGDKHLIRIKTQEGDSFTTTDLIFNVDFSIYPPGQPLEFEAPAALAEIYIRIMSEGIVNPGKEYLAEKLPD